MSSSRGMHELVDVIQQNKNALEARADALGLPLPTFDEDSPALSSDQEAAAARKAIEDAASELHELCKGPAGILTIPANNHHVAIHVVAKFNIAAAIPVDGDVGLSFVDLAVSCGLPADITKRIVKAAIAQHIFKEQPLGIVRHNAASRYLAISPEMRQSILMILEELWPAATKVAQAIDAFDHDEAQRPDKTAYSLAHGTQQGFFDFMASQPLRSRRFADTMTWFSNGPGLEVQHLVNGFPWGELRRRKVVDVGGSFGVASMAIAQTQPDIRFIVQDRPEIVTAAKAKLPAHIANVEFEEHDFFTEQPVKDADVYLLRQILHDWSNEYAARIVRALVPALEASGGRLVVMEQIVPNTGAVSLPTERGIRSFDLAMLQLFNGRERDLADWELLFSKANERLMITRVDQPPGSRMGIIHVRLRAADDSMDRPTFSQ